MKEFMSEHKPVSKKYKIKKCRVDKESNPNIFKFDKSDAGTELYEALKEIPSPRIDTVPWFGPPAQDTELHEFYSSNPSTSSGDGIPSKKKAEQAGVVYQAPDPNQEVAQFIRRRSG